MASYITKVTVCAVIGLSVYAAYAEQKEDNTSKTTSYSFIEANITASSLVTPYFNVTYFCLLKVSNVSLDFAYVCENLTGITPSIRLEDIYEAKIYLYLLEYCFYVTNVPGFVTNPLTIMLILYMKPFNTTSLYILVLSANDFIIIISRFIFNYLDSIYFYWTTELCCFFQFVISSSSLFSNYILVFWTFERFCAVWFPLKLSSWFVLARIKVILILLFIFSFALTTPYAFGFYAGQSPATQVQVCHPTEFLSTVWLYIEAFYYVFIPLCAIGASNIAIILRLQNTNKTRRTTTNDKQIIKNKKEEQRKLTITLISVSAVFVFLHVPYVLVIAWSILYPDPSVILVNNPTDFVRFALYTYIGLAIMEIQNWINFFIYILSGKKFRNALSQICSKMRKPLFTYSSEMGGESGTQRTDTGNTSVQMSCK